MERAYEITLKKIYKLQTNEVKLMLHKPPMQAIPLIHSYMEKYPFLKNELIYSFQRIRLQGKESAKMFFTRLKIVFNKIRKTTKGGTKKRAKRKRRRKTIRGGGGDDDDDGDDGGGDNIKPAAPDEYQDALNEYFQTLYTYRQLHDLTGIPLDIMLTDQELDARLRAFYPTVEDIQRLTSSLEEYIYMLQLRLESQSAMSERHMSDVKRLNDQIKGKNDVITKQQDAITNLNDVITKHQDVMTIKTDVITKSSDLIRRQEEDITRLKDALSRQGQDLNTFIFAFTGAFFLLYMIHFFSSLQKIDALEVQLNHMTHERDILLNQLRNLGRVDPDGRTYLPPVHDEEEEKDITPFVQTDDFSCAICGQRPVTHVLCPCGHMFHKKCVIQHVRTKMACPTCGKITPIPKFKFLDIQNILDDLKELNVDLAVIEKNEDH
jgi:hypothetical protein